MYVHALMLNYKTLLGSEQVREGWLILRLGRCVPSLRMTEDRWWQLRKAIVTLSDPDSNKFETGESKCDDLPRPLSRLNASP